MADAGETSAKPVKGSATQEQEDADSSFITSEDPQTGVVEIEAISQAWARWSLIAAYLG